MKIMITAILSVTAIFLSSPSVESFTGPSAFLLQRSSSSSTTNANNKLSSSGSSSCLYSLLSLELEKPLGIILEEIEEGGSEGVKVEELSDAGSAYASPYRDSLVGLKIARVMDSDVSKMSFDDVMDCIINAPSPVNIAFEVDDDSNAEELTSFAVGTTISIKVLQDGNPEKTIEAKVGDNLRKTLLENNVEVYRGLKKKLGNCGGGGQCGFCAVDFVESEGWQARSEYENGKIAKIPTARLACLNNIQGPATIRVE